MPTPFLVGDSLRGVPTEPWYLDLLYPVSMGTGDSEKVQAILPGLALGPLPMDSHPQRLWLLGSSFFFYSLSLYSQLLPCRISPHPILPTP